jgi:GntR family transcriptional repressor for pyruvate dehydrogenase complex
MSLSPKSKVYEEVLREIQHFIKKKQLGPGDKLPSERELSEQLNAGRSSIREALRAMELLGLIETRRGEGTFLRTYRPYHTVELLSAFILHEPKTKNDILVAKKIIEKEAAKLAFSRIDKRTIQRLDAIIHDDKVTPIQKHFNYFSLIFSKTENDLLQKIWELLEDFSNTVHQIEYNDYFYEDLLNKYINDEYVDIEGLFEILYRKND